MKVIKYSNSKHFNALINILQERNCYLPTKEEMPKTGYVAIEGASLIAAAFIRRVEGGHGQLDGLTTNPKAPSELRHEAIDRVVQSCINRAKELNIRNIVAFTQDVMTKERSLRHGFVKLPHHLVALNLGV